MNQKPLNSLTQEECIEYFNALQANAAKQWESARILSDAENYRTATSLLLVSIEEDIKSIIMYLDSLGFNFRQINGIELIFSNHRIRFFIAYFMFAVVVFGEDFLKWGETIKNNPEKVKEDLLSFIKSESQSLKFKYYILKKLIALKREMNFFRKADLTRQFGFYEDSVENMSSQKELTRKEYTEIFEKLNKVKLFSKQFVSIYKPNDPETIELINQNVRIFNTKKFSESIEKGLLKAKKTKYGPFELLDKEKKKEKS